MTEPSGRGGWDLTDADVAEIMAVNWPDARCNAGSPTVKAKWAEPCSYTCTLEAGHDGYHSHDAVEWRDPEPILGEPKPWHPGHRPHDPRRMT